MPYLNKTICSIITLCLLLAASLPQPAAAQTDLGCIPQATSRGIGAYARGGPGVQFGIVFTLTAEQTATVLGRAAESQWWQVQMPSGSIGWIHDSVISVSGLDTQINLLNQFGQLTTLAATWTPTLSDCVEPIVEADVTVAEVTEEAEPMGVLIDAVAAESTEIPYSAYNLSQSGASTAPVLYEVNGEPHVLWQDAGLGVVLAQRNDGQWQRRSLAAPFDQLQVVRGEQAFIANVLPPKLVAVNDILHAVWVSSDGLLLFASRPLADEAADWSETAILGSDVLAFDLSFDFTQNGHVAFLTSGNQSNQAGIYHVTRVQAGWEAPQLVEPTPYLRQQSAENATLAMAIVGNRLHVTWDDTVRERIMLASTTINNANWSTSVVDQRLPEDTQVDTAPSHVQLINFDGSLYTLWQAGHSGSQCQHYMRSSSDRGRSWSDPTVITTVSACLDSVNVSATNELLLLSGQQNGTNMLLAWDGLRWSEPQTEPLLANMTDPATFRSVEYSCLNFSSTAATTWLAGCEQNSGDIWFFERPLAEVDSWFPTALRWQAGSDLAVATAAHLQTVATADGVLHSFWQHDDSTLFYARYQDATWSTAVPIIQRGAGQLLEPQIALADDTLYVVWRDGVESSLQFSRVAAQFAGDAAEWTDAAAIAAPTHAVATPQLAVDSAGALYVAYAVPINAERGVYLVNSADSGSTWSDPLPVFQTNDPTWQIFSDPQLVIGANGSLHLQWTRAAALNGVTPVGLYRSYSTDGGSTWEQPVQLNSGIHDWSRLLGSADGALHQLWQTESGLRHDVSADFGQTWRTVTTLTDFAQLPSGVAFLADSSGRLHLAAVADTQLRQWLWDGSRWQLVEAYRLPHAAAQFGTQLALAEHNENTLTAVALVQQSEERALSVVSRQQAAFSADIATFQPVTTLSADIAVEVAVEPTAPPEAAPVVEAQVAAAESSRDILRNAPTLTVNGNLPLLIGVLLAAVLIVPIILYSRFGRRPLK